MITFDLGASAASYRFDFMIAGRCTVGAASGDTVSYHVLGGAQTDGASATIVKTPFQDVDEDDALINCNITLIASGNNIILQVTGIAAHTIDYKAVGQYVVV